MPVGALIETGHFTLALVWRRLSVPITACEIMCRRFFVVPLQKVLSCIQNTGMRTEDATKNKKEKPQQTADLAAGGRGTGQRRFPVQEVTQHKGDGDYNPAPAYLLRGFGRGGCRKV
jgi:hypothetical protein